MSDSKQVEDSYLSSGEGQSHEKSSLAAEGESSNASGNSGEGESYEVPESDEEIKKPSKFYLF